MSSVIATGERSALPAPDAALQAVVVVPARDESARIRGCLVALCAQLGVAPEIYEVIVVLDGCRDATAACVDEIMRQAPPLRLHALELERSLGVGVARRLGMDLACERLMALDRPEGLIASTDADSVVAPDWLGAQLALARHGARAIGGNIELDLGEAEQLPETVLFERERRAAARLRLVLAGADATGGEVIEHHHFSGASLALTAQTYLECGGLPARAALEDEALELRLRKLRIPIQRSRSVSVRTSARTAGRAPRGLARDLASSSWRARRTFRASEFPLERLLAAKRESIALVLPAREVAGTVGQIVEHAVRLRDAGLFDEVLVVDAASEDGSALIAETAGATVVQESELSSRLGPARGKGDAMWRALQCVSSEIVAFADTDTVNLAPEFLTGLVGPLVCNRDVQLVKGTFVRPFRTGESVSAHGGGRVTELLARPLLNLHAPELAVFDQPLAGEVAARRALLEAIPFAAGYGVEIAMLIDAWRLVGLDGLAQVDLGARQNRHQSLRDLSAMAYAVLVAAESRFLGRDFADTHAVGSISLPALGDDTPIESRPVTIEERPPVRELRELAPAESASSA
jgi:glycosyltransferase involved in cell wall biosynthesis